MSGNSFGERFRVTTFGESHGVALGAVVEGCPPGLEISEADLQGAIDGCSGFLDFEKEDARVSFDQTTEEACTLIAQKSLAVRRATAK